MGPYSKSVFENQTLAGMVEDQGAAATGVRDRRIYRGKGSPKQFEALLLGVCAKGKFRYFGHFECEPDLIACQQEQTGIAPSWRHILTVS
jgi:hypothetical protein